MVHPNLSGVELGPFCMPVDFCASLSIPSVSASSVVFQLHCKLRHSQSVRKKRLLIWRLMAIITHALQSIGGYQTAPLQPLPDIEDALHRINISNCCLGITHIANSPAFYHRIPSICMAYSCSVHICRLVVDSRFLPISGCLPISIEYL